MNARKVLLVALLVALAAAPVRAQEDSLKWWWSPGLGLYASKINEARDLLLKIVRDPE